MKTSQTTRLWILGSLVVAIAVGWRIHRMFQEVHQKVACISLSSSAEEGQNSEVIECLKQGTDPNCENGQLLREALKGGHQDTAELLRKAGARELSNRQL